MWHNAGHENATVGRVRKYLNTQLKNVLHHEKRGEQFDYRSFYHALKWELERLEAEAER